MNTFALFNHGFRPFFLFGSLWGIILIAVWVAIYAFGLDITQSIDPISWHWHEMLYGFAFAIISGFLLTASSNWTQSKTLSGKPLMFLFSVWALARLLFLGSLFVSGSIFEIWYYFTILIDLIYLPLFVFFLAPPILKIRQTRNYHFLIVSLVLFVCNLYFHLSSLGHVSRSDNLQLFILFLIIFFVYIIAGRVIPFFSNNAIANCGAKRIPRLEFLCLTTFGLVAVGILLDYDRKLVGGVAILCSFLSFVRGLNWKPLKTYRNPLLWILHVGQLWLVLGLLLIGLSLSGIADFTISVGVHSLASGALATFILGMMSRVSLGHTGRQLVLPRGFIFSYLAIILTGLFRILAGVFPFYFETFLIVAGVLWVVAFALFVIYYGRILISARPDGRVG